PAVKWLETRVFVRQASGWKGVSYAWNEAQTSAAINYGGGAVPVSFIDESGATVHTDYVVPDGNQCTASHSPPAPAPTTPPPTPPPGLQRGGGAAERAQGAQLDPRPSLRGRRGDPARAPGRPRDAPRRPGPPSLAGPAAGGLERSVHRNRRRARPRLPRGELRA